MSQHFLNAIFSLNKSVVNKRPSTDNQLRPGQQNEDSSLTSYERVMPKNWQDYLKLAKELNKRGKGSFASISAKDDDSTLLMVELIRAAGGAPENLTDTVSLSALKFLKKLWDVVNIIDKNKITPNPKELDWHTVGGHLLAENLGLARNWAFQVSLIRDAGMLEKFEFGIGLGYGKNKPTTLLGGDVLALPIGLSEEERTLSLKLASFLISKPAQEIIVKELSWPAMRLDVQNLNLIMKDNPTQSRKYYSMINDAVAVAEPTPLWWSPKVANVYEDVFNLVTTLQHSKNLKQALIPYQDKLRLLVKKRQQLLLDRYSSKEGNR